MDSLTRQFKILILGVILLGTLVYLQRFPSLVNITVFLGFAITTYMVWSLVAMGPVIEQGLVVPKWVARLCGFSMMKRLELRVVLLQLTFLGATVGALVGLAFVPEHVRGFGLSAGGITVLLVLLWGVVQAES